MQNYIHTIQGNYLGFISGNNLFSRDGEYLGWLEGQIVWDKKGNYRGNLQNLSGHYYILRPTFSINPIPRVPHVYPVSPIAPTPAPNVLPIMVPLGYEDGFKERS